MPIALWAFWASNGYAILDSTPSRNFKFDPSTESIYTVVSLERTSSGIQAVDGGLSSFGMRLLIRGLSALLGQNVLNALFGQSEVVGSVMIEKRFSR